MAHSRCLLPLAAVVLAFTLPAPMRAQAGLVCSSSAAVTPTLRHEGFTELTGDILLTCVGAPGSTPTPPGSVIPQADISVSLGVPVTSRILGGTSPELLTDALLLVDDPAPANQTVCLAPTNPVLGCQVIGDGGQTFNKPGKFNVFQGLGGSDAPQPNSITFLGVPVDPGIAARTYRITNVRIDATQVPSSSGGLSPVMAFVSSSPATSILISNPQNYVGFAADGLTAVTSAASPPFLQCLTYPTTKVGTATFTENFSTAFKIRTSATQNTPGDVYYSESGLEINLGTLPAGLADTGTRLQTFISNIPPGVSIYVDNWAQSTASICPAACSDATLVTSGGTPFDPGSNTITQVTNGAETSVLVQWEITNTNSSAIDSVTFNIYASLTGMPPANQSVAAISAFSPQSAAWSSTGAIPEFSSTVNVAPTPVNLFTIAPCPLISGQVTLSGNGLNGVAVALTGSDRGTTTTVGSGSYSFAVPAGGNYTITPTLAGYTFTPPNQTFTNLSGSQTANFTAQTSTTKFRTLYSFPGGDGGAYPYAGVVVGGGGVLYGTASADGASNHGVVFSLAPTSTQGVWNPKILDSFAGGAAGSDPKTALLIGKGSVLYGAAGSTIFSLTPPASPSGPWTEAVLSSSVPASSNLVIGTSGVLYGTTPVGGTANLGSVFSLTPPASPGGAWIETVLYSFKGGTDGSGPRAGVVIGTGGILYGTTYSGGAGYGTVFSLTPPTSGTGPWTEAIVYSFRGGTGAHPESGVVLGASGVLYGTTYYGGTSGSGTVYSLTPPKTSGAAWTKTVLYDFAGNINDGAYPVAGVVIGAGGVLYGATEYGGTLSRGTIYSLTPPIPGGAWTETVLYNFTGSADGGQPQASLVIGSSGALYGTTIAGGAFSDGTVFSILP